MAWNESGIQTNHPLLLLCVRMSAGSITIFKRAALSLLMAILGVMLVLLEPYVSIPVCVGLAMCERRWLPWLKKQFDR
jgi:hypothetical protein